MITYLLILVTILLIFYIYSYKENVDIPLIENVLLPIQRGADFIDPNIVIHHLPPMSRSAYELISRPIISTTPESIYRQIFG